MGCELVACTLALASVLLRVASGAPPSALFVFGDSLVDTGNNNNLQSVAKANFAFHGIDYIGHKPTGRFCNGRTIFDFLSEYWGKEPVLPILHPNATGQNLLRGANFASAGGGILDETGFIFGERLSMNKQVELYQKYVGNVTELVGASETARLLSTAPHFFVTGTNDFLANYELPFSKKKKEISLPDFENILLSQFREQLKAFYQLGARIMVIANLGPLGCIPLLVSQLAIASSGASGGNCDDKYVQVAMSYNAGLKTIVEGLRQELPDAKFLYYNAFDAVLDIVQNYSKYGFEYNNKGCCGGGPYRGLLPCNARAPLCNDRSLYVFWDPFHPSEATNNILTNILLNGTPLQVSPMNLLELFA